MESMGRKVSPEGVPHRSDVVVMLELTFRSPDPARPFSDLIRLRHYVRGRKRDNSEMSV